MESFQADIIFGVWDQEIMDKKIIYIILFCAAFLVRLVFVLNSPQLPQADGVAYDTIATSIASGSGFIVDDYYSRPPGYPYFLAGIYAVFGKSYLAVKIIQAIISAITCVFIYMISMKIFGSRNTAFLAYVFSAAYIGFIKSADIFLTECLLVFMLAILALCLINLNERFGFVNSAAFGFFAGIASLISGSMVLFPVFMLLGGCAFKYFRTPSAGKCVTGFIFSMLAFCLTLAPWTLRNYGVYHEIIPVSTQGAYHLYNSYFPPQDKLFGFNVRDENVMRAASMDSPSEASRFLVKKVSEFAKLHPFKVLRLELLKFAYFWSPFDWEIFGEGLGIYNYLYMFLFPFFMVAAFACRRIRYAPLILLVILYFQVLTLIFHGSPRYRLPVDALIIVLASGGIAYLYARFQQRRVILTCAISGFFAVNFLLYLHSFQFKFAVRDLLTAIRVW